MKYRFKNVAIIFTCVLVLAGLVWAGAVSVRPYGVATPYWYGYSSGVKSTYYLSHPTLSSNDEACGIATTQTLTNKTLTAPTVTTPTITGDGSTSTTGMLRGSETVAAANTINAAECGKTFYLSAETEFASALPALSTVSAGCRMKFVVAAAPSSASYTVTTGNSLENKIYGLVVVNGASVDGEDEDTITFADGAAVVGDWVEVESDGSSWFVSGQGVAAGAITLTAAD